jgi:hypothetical protein
LNSVRTVGVTLNVTTVIVTQESTTGSVTNGQCYNISCCTGKYNKRNC